MEFKVYAYLKLEFRVIFLIGFLFFRRPEPSPMEDLADETSVVVIDTSLISWYRKGDTFKLLFHKVMMTIICIIMTLLSITLIIAFNIIF